MPVEDLDDIGVEVPVEVPVDVCEVSSSVPGVEDAVDDCEDVPVEVPVDVISFDCEDVVLVVGGSSGSRLVVVDDCEV